MDEIRAFRGEYRWLSNFGLDDVYYEGALYPTSEHAYQAAKTLNPAYREEIRRAPTPGKAKALGSALKLRPGWDTMRVEVMQTVLYAKYWRHEHLRKQLLATGDAVLIEGNHWGDRFWGVCAGEGANHLGKLLMEIRADLREYSGPFEKL